MSAPGSGNGAGEAARNWWKRLQPSNTAEGDYRRGDRASLARLRRASSWVEAAAEPQTIALFRSLPGMTEKKFPRVAVLACVLAHVRNDDKGRTVAKAIGAPLGKEEDAILKPMRLRRLLNAKGDEVILTGFRRLVALMGDAADVADLAQNILAWDFEKTRMKFAFEYWQAGPAAPGAVNTGNNAAA